MGWVERGEEGDVCQCVYDSLSGGERERHTHTLTHTLKYQREKPPFTKTFSHTNTHLHSETAPLQYTSHWDQDTHTHIYTLTNCLILLMACLMQLPTWRGHQWRLIQHFLQMTLLLSLLCPPTEPVPWDNDSSSGPGEVRTAENEQMIPAGRTRMHVSVCSKQCLSRTICYSVLE